MDKKEYGFERRELLHQTQIKGKLWAYFVIGPKVPTDEYPIALTYVDTVIAGCLMYSDDFAKEFLRDTVNWEFPFINDRDNPRFPRRSELRENQLRTINRLLKEILPRQYVKFNID